MAEPTPTPQDRQHVLRAPVAVRPLGIAGASTVVGALLLVVSWSVGSLAAVAWVGGVIVALGVALAALTWWWPTRMAVRVDTTPGGYRITSGTAMREGRWVEVVRATQSGSGIRITLERRDGTEHHIFSPAGGFDTKMNAVAHDVAQRLKNRYDAGIDS